ncbi:hypothetical protein [Methanobrevibacter sp.]|uniref:hypothetical protein n=1 Tax=Methanobrevibacter sp. TaxID=66852 RepID=UPI00388EC878
MTNCNISGDFIENIASRNGGAIYFNGVTSDCRVVGNFTNNTSPYGGAIIFHTTVNSNIYGNFLKQ